MDQPSPHHVYPPGTRIPGTVYVVRKKLGEGGMGVVYEVEDTSIGKIYVVKTVHLRHAGKSTYSDLTRNEARMLARLRHRNIVEVITAGTTDDANRLAYFVMEKLEGCTLASLKGVVLPAGYVWQIGRELLDALQYVHHPKDDRPVIVHRDIKPENIFLAKVEEDDGAGGDSSIRHRVKLLDFGIGTIVGVRPEGFWGTARYGSPEQLRLEPVSPKTDLYAAAIVLFELLTGRHPFEGAKTAREFMDAHRVQIPPRVSEFVHVPKAVDDCIDAALSKVPERRPKDAHKMMSALAELRTMERPFSQRHGNTTIQDLNTVIERQTQAGYEAYASSSGDTIEGMTRPPEEGNAPEVAYSSGAARLAVARTERATPGASKGETVPMAAPRQGGFREAPTRSLREPQIARGVGTDTEQLPTDELLEGLGRLRSLPPSRRAPTPLPSPESPRAARTAGGTSAAVESSIVLPVDGPSKERVAKIAIALVIAAAAIATFVSLRQPPATSAMLDAPTPSAAARGATRLAAAPPDPEPSVTPPPVVVVPGATPSVGAHPAATASTALSAGARPRAAAPRPPGTSAAGTAPLTAAPSAKAIPSEAPSAQPKPPPRDDFTRTF